MAKQVRKVTLSAAAATAYHEAGHAVAVWQQMGRKPYLATIVPDQERDGAVLHPNPLRGIRLDIDNTGPRAESRAQQAIVICFAGVSAQRRFAPRSVRSWHRHDDYQKAFDIAASMCGSKKESNAYLRWLRVRCENLVETKWPEIQAVAKALLESHKLNGDEILAAIISAGRQVK